MLEKFLTLILISVTTRQLVTSDCKGIDLDKDQTDRQTVGLANNNIDRRVTSSVNNNILWLIGCWSMRGVNYFIFYVLKGSIGLKTPKTLWN